MRGRSGLPVFLAGPGQLPCGGGRYGFGSVGELRDDAELLHKAQGVPVNKAFRYLAVRDASDGHPGDGDVLPGWSNAIDVTFMGAPAEPAGHDCFAFGNDILDRQMEVGESCAIECRALLFAVGAAPKIGRRRVIVIVVGGKDLVDHRQIAIVPEFGEKTTDDSFIMFRHLVFSYLRNTKTVLA